MSTTPTTPTTAVQPLTLSPAQLSTLLAKTIPAKLPVLIKGRPGIGKSDCVSAAADATNHALILSHPVTSDPTDFKGLPCNNNGKADFLPFGDLRQLIETTKPTVFFMDDLGQAPAVVQAAAMQLILARQVNGHKVSKHVVFMAATNRREDRAGVTGILEPVKSRFATIVELAPTVQDWSTWALNNDVPPIVVAFTRFRHDLFDAPHAPTNDIVNGVSPRTITNMGRLYAAGIDDLPTLAGAVGKGYASEFLGFARVWQSMPSLDGILINPDSCVVPTDISALFAVATGLAARASKDNIGRVLRYLTRMPPEFGALCVRDAQTRCPAVMSTSNYIKWSVDHQDILV